MVEITICQARPEHLPQVEILWTHYAHYHKSLGQGFPLTEQASSDWRSSFERTLGRYSFLWIALQGEEICGFLLARIKRAPAFLGGVLVGEISDLFVAESMRGQHIGKRLAEQAIANLHTHQVHSIEVKVLQQNNDACIFWKKIGFHVELIQLRIITDV